MLFTVARCPFCHHYRRAPLCGLLELAAVVVSLDLLVEKGCTSGFEGRAGGAVNANLHTSHHLG